MCRFKEPDNKDWKIYYLKQIHPDWNTKKLAEFLSLGNSTVHRTLSIFKMTPRNNSFIPEENMEKVLEILRNNPSPKNLLEFLKALNYCPLFPKAHQIKDLLEDILIFAEPILLPEVIVYLYSLILKYPRYFAHLDNAAVFEHFANLRLSFQTKGLMYSYWLSTIPHIISSIRFIKTYNPEEFKYSVSMLDKFPPFYRELFENYRELFDAIILGKEVTVNSVPADNLYRRFYEYTGKGQYEKLLELEEEFQKLHGEARQMFQIISTNVRMFLSPSPPTPPKFDFEPTSLMVAYYSLTSKLLYARLTKQDPLQLLKGDPVFELLKERVIKTFLEPDIQLLEKEAYDKPSTLLFLLAKGEIEEAWKMARKTHMIYDFHVTYIALGLPLIDLLMKYNLRIRWIKPIIEIHPGKLIIRYAGQERTIRGSTAHILKEIVKGKGYLGKRELRKLYRLKFLNFKKKRYGRGKVFVKLEDDVAIKLNF